MCTRRLTAAIVLLLAGVAIALVMAGGRGNVLASGGHFTREPNTDRSGNDIRSLELAAEATVEACEQHCRDTPGCVAFTLVKRSTTVPQPICRLKDATPYGHESSCCTSGMLKK